MSVICYLLYLGVINIATKPVRSFLSDESTRAFRGWQNTRKASNFL